MLLCVVHNNERVRLDYLLPRLERLSGFQVCLIGPDASGMAEHVLTDTVANRVRRAKDLADTATACRDPRKKGRPSWLRFFLREIRSRRRIKIEQEVMEAHKLCWQRCADDGTFAVVLESDARFQPHTEVALGQLLRAVEAAYSPKTALFADLAGGCDRQAIAGARFFDPVCGYRQIAMTESDAVQFELLPEWTGNTVCGYLLSARFARLLLAEAQARPVLLPPDWAMNAFSRRNAEIRDAVCIHSTPTIFTQGSMDGSYESGIG